MNAKSIGDTNLLVYAGVVVTRILDISRLKNNKCGDGDYKMK